MKKIVGVRFRKPGKVYFFDPDKLNIEKGQKVIVETSQGQEIGDVTTGVREIEELTRGAQAPKKNPTKKTPVFSAKHTLYESLMNKKENFEQIKSRMEADEIRIIKLYGKNGIL